MAEPSYEVNNNNANIAHFGVIFNNNLTYSNHVQALIARMYLKL